MENDQVRTAAFLHNGVPACWRLWFEKYLECSPKLSKHLWWEFCEVGSNEQMFMLRQVDQHRGRDDDILIPLLRPVQPKDILHLCARFSPTDGRRPRRPEIIRLEEAILERTNAAGEWL